MQASFPTSARVVQQRAQLRRFLSARHHPIVGADARFYARRAVAALRILRAATVVEC